MRFQKSLEGLSADEIKQKAIEEFDAYVAKLRANNIESVTVIQDTDEPAKPDAIFPNNWISMHENGTVFLYPMLTENRRLEIRPEILEELKTRFIVSKVNDITASVNEGKFLEAPAVVFSIICIKLPMPVYLRERIKICLSITATSFSTSGIFLQSG